MDPGPIREKPNKTAYYRDSNYRLFFYYFYVVESIDGKSEMHSSIFADYKSDLQYYCKEGRADPPFSLCERAENDIKICS